MVKQFFYLILSACIFFNLNAQHDSLRQKSNNWKSRGNFFALQKKHSLAVKAYHTAIDIDSTNAIAYYKLYRDYHLLGMDTALYYLKKAYIYNPFLNDSLLLEISHYYLNLGDYETSLSYLRKHNKLYNTSIEINYAIRKHKAFLYPGFKKRIVIFYPITDYDKSLKNIIEFLKKSKYKCVLKSFYNLSSDSYKNLDQCKEKTTLIKDFLISKGLNKEKIKVINYGSSKNLVEPKDPLASKYNNRLEIEIIW